MSAIPEQAAPRPRPNFLKPLAAAVVLAGVAFYGVHWWTAGRFIEDTDDALLELTLSSGLFGTFHHMQAALPHLKQRGGAIINFGSFEGIHGGAGFAAYAATKEAIRGLSRTAARELGKYAIRVNVVCPAAASPVAVQWIQNLPEEAKKVLAEIALVFGAIEAEAAGR